PKIGHILNALLEEMLDEPSRNTPEYLEQRARELAALGEEELKRLGDAGKQKREQIEQESIKEIRGKYFVE
ncbi:MAG: Polynucleotide adenylyltransferase, partial [Parcubacteria group bacterium Gr01-1014_72]